MFLDVVAAAVLVYWGTRLRDGLLRWVHRNGGWSVGGYDSISIDVFEQWTYLSLIGMLIVLSVLRPIQHMQHQQHE